MNLITSLWYQGNASIRCLPDQRSWFMFDLTKNPKTSFSHDKTYDLDPYLLFLSFLPPNLTSSLSNEKWGSCVARPNIIYNIITYEPCSRKTNFSICKNKGADQLRNNCAADQHLCFNNLDSTIPLLSKSKISSLAIFSDCTAHFESDLVGNPIDQFSQNGAHVMFLMGSYFFYEF